MNFFNDLSPEAKKKLSESRQNPLAFAETFLYSPNPGPPYKRFKANYAQTHIMSSKSRDTWVCVSRRAGKCLDGGSYIVDARTRRPVRIDKAQGCKGTFSFDFETNKVESSLAEWTHSGVKMCRKIKLESGVSLTLSLDHPVFTKKGGWVTASTINVGDELLSIGKMDHGTETLTDLELELIYDQVVVGRGLPDEVFNLNEPCLTYLLKRIFSHYGRVDERGEVIAQSFFNKSLAFDIQHLLYRYEIYSRVTRDGVLRIENSLDRTLFMKDVLGFEFSVFETKNPRNWDLVVNVKEVGYREVYDMCVGHIDINYIANNIIVHNSFSFTVIALWHAITQENKKIHVFASSQTQIDEFFTTIDDWIGCNPLLQEFKIGQQSSPPERRFITGSIIYGHILNAQTRDKLRGITADVVFCDEAQQFDVEDWKVIIPIMAGDETRFDNMRNYVAGTLNKAEGHYYIKIDKSTPGEFEKVIKIPITENKNFTKERVAQIEKQVADERIWKTEYLLQVAEESSAVFKKEDVDRVFSDDWEPSMAYIHPAHPLFLTVDWDKVQCGTNLLISQYDPVRKSVKLIHHEEIPRGQWTYTLAVQRIIELYEIYQPEFVIVDQGASEKQWEDLQLEALKRPDLNLAASLERLAFQSKVKYPDLYTGEDVVKQVKPYLVELLRKFTQEDKLKIPTHMEFIKEQFMDYKIEARTANTVKFSAKNEHVIDCFLFVMWGIFKYYENPYEPRHNDDHLNFVKIPIDEDIHRMRLNEARKQDTHFEDPNLDEFYRAQLDTNIFGYTRSSF